MTTPVFDPEALQAKIAAVQVAFDAREAARAACNAADAERSQAEDEYNLVRNDAVAELGRQAGLGDYQF